MISRKASGLLPPTRHPVRIDLHPGIVVHCTGGQRPPDHEHALQRWRVAQTTHQLGNGWSDIGYHFGVTPEGVVLEGRGWHVLGAHAKGRNRWLGVVFLGKGLELTDAEQAAFRSLRAEHLQRGGGELVLPHNAFSRKACPGPAVTAWVLEQFGEVLS